MNALLLFYQTLAYMKRSRAIRAAGVIVLSAAIRTATILVIVAVWIALVARPSAPLYEDQPGWDCRTMGNRICGEVSSVPSHLE